MPVGLPIYLPVGYGKKPDSYYIYAVHEYRYGNVVTIWVGKEGRSYRTWHVWLKWWVFSSPAERIRDKRDKAQKLADKLNHREMFMAHEVEVSKR